MESLQFHGRPWEYFKIWIVNILLTLITLGIYYPWAKVRNRRYLYGNTTLNDKNFEYHATGKQIFLGYLIAMVLLISFVVLQSTFPLFSGLATLLFFLAFPWIIWRSFKFNMRMTSFSNVRFSFEGTLGRAYINYLLLPLALLIVFYVPVFVAAFLFAVMGGGTGAGLIVALISIATLVAVIYLFSYLQKVSHSYAINGSRYGQASFSTDLDTSEFLKITLKTAAIGFLSVVALFLIVGVISAATVGAASLMSAMEGMNDPETAEAAFANIAGVVIPVYLGFIFIGMFVSAYLQSRQRSYIYSQSKLDDSIALASTLTARNLAWTMFTNFLLVVFTLGLGIPWAQVRMARLMTANTQVDTSQGFDEYITQKQNDQSALGEQIGEAFDADIGIAI